MAGPPWQVKKNVDLSSIWDIRYRHSKMSLVCAFSGVTPEEPVVSPSGFLFEKRLIVKALQNSSECPITGEKLSVEDLRPIQSKTSVAYLLCALLSGLVMVMLVYVVFGNVLSLFVVPIFGSLTFCFSN